MHTLAGSRPGGIFSKLAKWMLVPLLVIWPVLVVATYYAATAIAQQTFDHALRDMTRAVAEEAKLALSPDGGHGSLPVLESLRNDPIDRYYVQLSWPDGSLIAGDAAIPRVDVAPRDGVALRDGSIAGRPARIATAVRDIDGRVFHVQVGDPLTRRTALVSQVTRIVVGVLFLILPVSVVLAGFATWRGLRPLRALRRRIEERRPDDLAPIPADAVPPELAPLVSSLNAQLAAVDRSLQSQKRFIADAAHQMKTPLAGLKVLAETARRETDFAKARERLSRIAESADRMSRLVAQLLALARADEAGSHAPPTEMVNLNALLREVCASWADRAIAHGVNLAFDASPLEPTVRGSPVLLRELFGNLVDNAIRYTPRGGEVAVRVAPGPPPRVAVEDTGPGIPVADRDLVFERFHRVLGAPGTGSGLGLPIVKAIATLHGATIDLDDGPGGVGTRIAVAFP